MSTVCVLGHPAPGHVHPNLALMTELVRRGEHVVYFATEPFRERIERTGATLRCYGEHALFERNLGSAGMLGGMAGLLQTTEEILPSLLASLRAERPDYLLIEAHAVWGHLVAQIERVPAVTMCSMFAINETLISAAQLMEHMYGGAPRDLAFDGLRALAGYYERARLLLKRWGAASPGIIDYLGNRQRLNLVFTAREFQIGGDALDDAYRFVGPSVAGREEMSTELAARLKGARPIFISMGTMYNDELELYRACFRAFADCGAPVVMAVGHRVERARLGPVPANFIVCEYAPQVAVLERAQLFITHGGINSAHEAMLHGVPMVVLPKSADHHVVARQVEAVGAGLVLERAQANEESVADTARNVLSDARYRERSRWMGERLRAAGGAVRAADEIFEFRQRAGER